MNGVIFILVMLLFLAVLFVATSQTTTATVRRASSYRAPRAASRRLHPVARAAMQKAGYEASDSYVQVTDIGLLAYRNTDEGKIVRQGDVLLDTRYLRPF